MSIQPRDVIICVIALLIILGAIKSGYKNGFAVELKKLLGIAVAVVCLVLILILKNAVSDKQYATAIVVIGAIVILSLGWKFVRMIFGLLAGLTDLPVLGWIDSLLGAIAGAIEGAAVIWIIYKIYCAFSGAL